MLKRLPAACASCAGLPAAHGVKRSTFDEADVMTEPAKPSQSTATPNQARPGRNEPCHCGSGLKYKKCCASKDDAARSADLAAQAAARAARAQAEREKAEAEGESSPDEKAAKGTSHRHSASNARPQRPKLPTAHNNNLPRRGAV
ncbi:MAG TPA: SEC-C metal-binding domain-containing protein [Polyangiaceae bacterium]|nr:SEC-C metal-binding domain-containing protein [Polyangiaceae bacterium]